MDLTNPGRALGRSCLLSISPKHPALFHKLISAGLPPCFARWTQSFLYDGRACMVYQNHKSRFFQVRRGVSQGSVLGPVLFSLINDLSTSLPSSVMGSLYADDLAIWSSSPLVLFTFGPHCGGGHTRSSVSIGALVLVLVSSSQFEQM